MVGRRWRVGPCIALRERLAPGYRACVPRLAAHRRETRRALTTLAFALAAAVALVSPAAAQVHTLAEDAVGYDVATDGGGTAHAVWSAPGDRLIYCRIPRGATGCELSRELPVLDQEFSRPVVVVTPANEILVSSHRCCVQDAFGGDLQGQQVFASSDGGASFGEVRHRVRGSTETAAFGPGDFAVSQVGGGAEGTWWQLFPFTAGGGGPQAVQLADLGSGKIFDGSAGLIDPTTPVAAYSDGERVYMRRHSGTGAYGDIANWGPEMDLGPGREARLASSPARGAFLYMHAGERGVEHVQIRRVTGVGLGPPIDLGTLAVGGSTRDFAQDYGGNLHVALTSNVAGLIYVRSTDAATFSRARVLAPQREGEGGINRPEIGAAPDGGGVALFKEGPDRLRFVAIEPAGGGGGSTTGCGSQVSIPPVTVVALQGEFRRRGRNCVVEGAVRVNGVDIEPLDGGALEVVVNPRTRTIETRQRANVRVGGVTLHRDRVDWRIPRGGGAVTDFPDLGRYAKEILGFPVDGDADFDVNAAGATIRTSFRLPELLGGVTAEVTLRTDQNGLRLQGLRVRHPGTLQAGLLRVRDLDITYSADPSVFSGTATFLLPPAYANTPRVQVDEIRFEEGEFVRGAFTLGLPAPLPIVAIPAPLLSLRDLGFDVETQPALKLAGGALFLAGPQAGGAGLIEVDGLPRSGGGISFTFPRGDQPAILRAGGELNLLGALPFASASAEFRTNGMLRFGGGLLLDDVPGLLIEARVPEERTFVDLPAGRFNAEFVARVCTDVVDFCPSDAEALISNRGIAACGTVPPPFPPVRVGGYYEWGATLPVIPFCDLDAVRVQASAAQAGGFTLGGGLPEAAIVLEGADGPPRVTITAPNGESLATPPPGERVVQGRFLAYTQPDQRRTIVQVAEPPAGRWQIDGPVSRVSVAEGLPEPRVQARVGGRGERRTLRYWLRDIPGQRVTFFESAEGAQRRIGRVDDARGSLGFEPASGPAGERQIVAFVEQNGRPRRRLEVATYRAPAPSGPARPRRVRVRRAGKRLVISWARVRGAREYEVRASLPVDGRRLMLRTRRRRAVVRRVERQDRARITVAGVDEALVVGRRASARLGARRR